MMAAMPDSFARYPSLAGKIVLISGGATGLGAEFVTQFAAQGARVAFVDIQDDAGRELAARVADAGYPPPVYRTVDVRDLDSYGRTIAEISGDLGAIEVLVNNAADDSRQPSATVDRARWDDRMRVNLDHHFFATRAVAPAMQAAGAGSIINLGSISTHIKLTDLVAYRTAKAAIEGLTRALAQELGPDGIRVNCILPGWIMTPRQLENWVDAEAEATIDREQALRRRLVPADVARLALWLAADDSQACTAQNWIVDGGWM